jgi:hypothetical protein
MPNRKKLPVALRTGVNNCARKGATKMNEIKRRPTTLTDILMNKNSFSQLSCKIILFHPKKKEKPTKSVILKPNKIMRGKS